jgi:hypothetical protein
MPPQSGSSLINLHLQRRIYACSVGKAWYRRSRPNTCIVPQGKIASLSTATDGTNPHNETAFMIPAQYHGGIAARNPSALALLTICGFFPFDIGQPAVRVTSLIARTLACGCFAKLCKGLYAVSWPFCICALKAVHAPSSHRVRKMLRLHNMTARGSSSDEFCLWLD